jgi:hypothetical protein
VELEQAARAEVARNQEADRRAKEEAAKQIKFQVCFDIYQNVDTENERVSNYGSQDRFLPHPIDDAECGLERVTTRTGNSSFLSFLI